MGGPVDKTSGVERERGGIVGQLVGCVKMFSLFSSAAWQLQFNPITWENEQNLFVHFPPHTVLERGTPYRATVQTSRAKELSARDE